MLKALYSFEAPQAMHRVCLHPWTVIPSNNAVIPHRVGPRPSPLSTFLGW